MLSDRRQRVLCALIEEYVARALPVGSRTLTERYQLGVSSATVRNDLSALEEAGYITQPHTSAGRIPTDAGYRAFVDDLLASGLIDGESAHAEVVNRLRESARELDDLMERTSNALTRLTDCLSVVVGPSTVSAHIRQLSLISLSNYHALIVIVDESGRVINRQVVFAEPVDPDDLKRVESVLNRLITGLTLPELQSIDAESLHEELSDPLVRYMLEEVVAGLSENSLGHTHRDGMSTLLRKPEFSTAQTLLPVMQVLEDETVLLHVFEDAMMSDGDCVVRIGRENPTAELSGVSVVAGRFGWGEGAGIVAVIGPTRMDYSRVIGAVRAARQALQDS